VAPPDGAAVLRTAGLLVAYDGTDFHGFAESDGVPTVLGELRAALERIVRRRVEPTGAGRTDRGVHAWGQVLSVPLPGDTDLDRVAHSLNRMCGPSIAVRSAWWAADDFSARFSATGRTYRYEVWNSPVPHPFLARTTWHVPHELDVQAMNDGAAALVGEHDFSSFCRRPRPVTGRPGPTMVRRLVAARWSEPEADGGRLLRFEITATSFCHQMVRSIVGTLVDVGTRRRTAGAVTDVLAARDRNAAGRVAPPTGLTLWSVDYSGRRWDADVGS